VQLRREESRKATELQPQMSAEAKRMVDRLAVRSLGSFSGMAFFVLKHKYSWRYLLLSFLHLHVHRLGGNSITFCLILGSVFNE